MLGGRDKIGSPSIDWKQSAFGRGKTPRKTIGFGKYDKRQRSFEFELYPTFSFSKSIIP